MTKPTLSSMRILRLKNRRVVFPIIAVCFFILTIIWVSYFRQRSFDKQDAIRFGVERNSNLAVALEQYTIRTLRNADAVLQMIRMEYQRADTMNLQELVTKNPFSRDMIEGVVMIGRDGRPSYTSMKFPPGSVPDCSDRPYFIFHANNEKDSLHLSEPLISRLTGKPVIVLSRRLNDANGKFSGVLAVLIQPSTFNAFYAQGRLLRNDILSLIAPNGITYARRTGNKESFGENISQSPLFVHIAEHADSFYYARDAIRRIPSWFSYRKLKDYPVIATVGSSEADILADFRTRQQQYIIPRIIISILVMLFSFLVARFILQRRSVSQQLVREEEKYRRLLTEQMIAVQEREREWIGRELHDNVGQVLTTVKLYLETAARENDKSIVLRSMQLINSSISEIRNLSHQLSAPTLGTRSLIDSIQALMENLAFTTNIHFNFEHESYQTRVPMSQKLALYRILQEQFNNIIKHAEATTVNVSLSQDGDHVVLTVKDDGKGFDARTKTCGMGINNIISRAKVFAGTAHIESAVGKGCCLTVIIPAGNLDAATRCYN